MCGRGGGAKYVVFFMNFTFRLWLARILSGMEQIRKDKKEAMLKIEFVTRKMQEDKPEEDK